MRYIKQVGCDCPDCPTDPCQSGCFCAIALDTEGGEEGFDQEYYVASDFPCDRKVNIDFESYSIKDTLIITAEPGTADETELYNSGCIGAHVTPTITVPGGTQVIRVQVVPHCDASQVGTTLWTLVITCGDYTCGFGNWAEAESGVTGAGVTTRTRDVTGEFDCAVVVSFQFIRSNYASCVLKANGSAIVTVACGNANMSTTVTVPAGTTSLSVEVTRQCSGAWNSSDLWQTAVFCP